MGAEPGERDRSTQPVFVCEAFERTDWLNLLRNAVEGGDIHLRVAGEYPISQVTAAQQAIAAGGLRICVGGGAYEGV